MAISIPSAIKRMALVTAISRLSKPRARFAASPEPIVRPLNDQDEIDALLFDVSRTELDETVNSLGSEMNRLDTALGSLREMLGVFAEVAPVHEDDMPSYAMSALHEDTMLFDGEPEFVGDIIIPEGDVDYLFKDIHDPKGLAMIRVA